MAGLSVRTRKETPKTGHEGAKQKGFAGFDRFVKIFT
jgi:hypothetical protein